MVEFIINIISFICHYIGRLLLLQPQSPWILPEKMLAYAHHPSIKFRAALARNKGATDEVYAILARQSREPKNRDIARNLSVNPGLPEFAKEIVALDEYARYRDYLLPRLSVGSRAIRNFYYATICDPLLFGDTANPTNVRSFRHHLDLTADEIGISEEEWTLARELAPQFARRPEELAALVENILGPPLIGPLAVAEHS